eukprot:scaffold25289_cov142-Cylindrotheca_fusiformis.AAC.2
MDKQLVRLSAILSKRDTDVGLSSRALTSQTRGDVALRLLFQGVSMFLILQIQQVAISPNARCPLP